MGGYSHTDQSVMVWEESHHGETILA
jgi:hypothetical protein